MHYFVLFSFLPVQLVVNLCGSSLEALAALAVVSCRAVALFFDLFGLRSFGRGGRELEVEILKVLKVWLGQFGLCDLVSAFPGVDMLLCGEQLIKQQTYKFFKDQSLEIWSLRESERLLVETPLHELYLIVLTANDRPQRHLARVVLVCHQILQRILYRIKGLENLLVAKTSHLSQTLLQGFLVLFEQNAATQPTRTSCLRLTLSFDFMDAEEGRVVESCPELEVLQGCGFSGSICFEDHVVSAVSQNEMLGVLFDDLEEPRRPVTFPPPSGRLFLGFSYHQILLSLTYSQIPPYLLTTPRLISRPAKSTHQLAHIFSTPSNRFVIYQLIQIGDMLGEGLNGDGKNSSAQVNISTSESVHLKLSSRQAENKPPAARRHLPTLELRQLEDPHLSNRNQPESESSSRLFTFMDEKEVERKIIQNYIFKNTFKNQSHLDGGQQPQKEKCKGGIVRMIEDSKKKRDEFLKKLTQNTSVLKENRSISKLNKMSRSKTPKNITVVQNKYETLCPRSRSKTPRLNPIKQNTPKTHREVQLFRAKSNLGKENVRNSTAKNNSRHNGTKGCKEQEELLKALEPFAGDQQNIKDRQNLNQKELLIKKRQLERQLTLVNETLLVVKKVDNGKKKGKVTGNGKGARKKSTKRLSKA